MARTLLSASLGALLALVGGACGEAPLPGSLPPPSADDDDDDDGPDGLAAAVALYDPDHVVEIELTVDPADLVSMSYETNTIFELLEGEDCMDEPMAGPFQWYPAGLVVDGVAFEEVGLRKKGLIGSLSATRPSLKIKFDKFVEGQTLDGIERLTLNNSISDASLLKQCLGYRVFEDAGIPAPRCNFAHVVVNGDDLGVYVNVEPLKKDFLKYAYDGADDGDLYEGTLSDFRPGWTNTFEAETSSTDPERGPLLAVSAALQIEDDAAMLEALGEVLDIDAFVRFWATELLIRHWDGYAGNRNNFFVYRPQGSQRLEFLPWGIDGILHPAPESEDPAVFAASLLPRRLWAVPELRAAYIAQLQELLAVVWDEDALLAEIDRMAALTAGITTPAADRLEAIATLRSVVEGRRARLEARLSAELPEFEQPLLQDICLLPVGDLSASFSTEWGTHGLENPLSYGASTMSGSLHGTPFALEGAAIAGQEGQRAVISTIALTGPTDAAQVYLTVPAWAMGVGELPIDGMWARAYWISVDFSDAVESTILGAVWNGQLELTSFGDSPGAAVEGVIAGALYSQGP